MFRTYKGLKTNPNMPTTQGITVRYTGEYKTTMAIVTLASSDRCSHCRKFSPKWNSVIGALPAEFQSYFNQPELRVLQKKVPTLKAVPQLIVRWYSLTVARRFLTPTSHHTVQIMDTKNNRMYDLEDTVLDVWRADADDSTTIKRIASAIEKHVDYTNSDHDDLVDFLTHLKLADISSQTKQVPVRQVELAIADPSTIMPRKESPKPAPLRKRGSKPIPVNKPYASFMDSSSILENSYVIGNEISYYGCDSICSVNV